MSEQSGLAQINIPPQFAGLIGIGLVLGAVLLFSYVVIKISRQGGLGTLLLWLFLTAIGGTIGIVFSAIVGGLENAVGGDSLGLAKDYLLVYWGAFAGVLLQGIVNGIRGKGYKVKTD